MRHDVLAREIVLALLEHDHQRLGDRVAVEPGDIVDVGTGQALLHELDIGRHRGIVARFGHKGLERTQRQYAPSGLDAGRHHHGRLVGAAAGNEALRLPADLGRLANRLRAGARRHRVDQEDVGLGVRERQHLRIHGRVGDLEARGHGEQLVRIRAQRFLDAAQIFLAGVVILVEHGKACVWIPGPSVFDVDRGLAGVVRRPGQRDRPGHVDRIVPFRGGADQEQLRHLVGIEIFGDRRARRRSHRGEDEGDAVVLDQPACCFHGLGRREGVVQRDQIELAAVDATLLIDLVEIGRDHLAGDAERGRRSAIGHGVADLDLGIVHPWTVGLRGSGSRQAGRGDRCG